MTHKFLLLGAILIVAGILVALFWQFQGTPAPQVSVPDNSASRDSTASQTDDLSPAVLNAEIDAIDLGDLDAEFQTIDADINSL